MHLTAVFQHFQVVHELSSGKWTHGKVSRNAVILALLLAAVGSGMAIYLVLMR